MPEPIGGVQPFAELARGGATVVYKGYQRSDDRFVLLKTVRPEWGEDADLVGRFEEEARLAAQVCHPNVVTVFDSGRDGATAYLITEFVEGLDLRALVERGALPPALAAYVLHEAAQGLAAAHAQGILHRDLKPANLLIAETGAVKLTDFGFASLAPTGTGDGPPADREVRGTLAYLAPEIVRGDAPSRASDLFSLGALLVEMLTGRPAFAREAAGATLDAVLHHDPLPAVVSDPRVPPALADLAAELLAKEPQHRLSEAAGVIEALEPVRARFPADADTLAAYLRNPASYVPPAPPPASSLPSRSEAEPASGSPTGNRPSKPGWRVGWQVAVGVLVLIVLGIVGTSLISERPGEPSDEPLRDPLATALPGAGDDPVAEAGGAVPQEGGADASLDRPASESIAPEPEVPSESQGLTSPVPDGNDAPDEDAETRRTEPPRDDLVESVPDVAPEPVSGTLVVAAEPWARVRIEGRDVGTTPLGALSLPAGRHRVTFENPDFPVHTVEVAVEGGEEVRLAVSLWDLVGRVTLVVSPWAEVAVDGTYWDTVPPQERPLVLSPGIHRLTFTHPSLGGYETSLRIAAGESRTLRVNLSTPPAPTPPPQGAAGERLP